MYLYILLYFITFIYCEKSAFRNQKCVKNEVERKLPANIYINALRASSIGAVNITYYHILFRPLYSGGLDQYF